ncbi:uncharacterized protein LOC144354866 [Saccoglossus kowalevskii]
MMTMQRVPGNFSRKSSVRHFPQNDELRRPLPPLDNEMRYDDMYHKGDAYRGLSSFSDSHARGNDGPHPRVASTLAKVKAVKLPPLVPCSSIDAIGKRSHYGNSDSVQLITQNANVDCAQELTELPETSRRRMKKKNRTVDGVPWDKINAHKDGREALDCNSTMVNARHIQPTSKSYPDSNIYPKQDDRAIAIIGSVERHLKNSKTRNVQLRYKNSLPPIPHGPHSLRCNDMQIKGEPLDSLHPVCSHGNPLSEQRHSEYEPGRRKQDLYSAIDLDHRPYTAKRSEWKDKKLDKYLQHNRKRRRNATCEMIDKEMRTCLVQFCEDLAILSAIQQCF